MLGHSYVNLSRGSDKLVAGVLLCGLLTSSSGGFEEKIRWNKVEVMMMSDDIDPCKIDLALL